jgi:hypothetical protein
MQFLTFDQWFHSLRIDSNCTLTSREPELYLRSGCQSWPTFWSGSQSWSILGSGSQSWSILGSGSQSWSILGSGSRSWSILGLAAKIGQIWGLEAKVGHFWVWKPKLANFGVWKLTLATQRWATDSRPQQLSHARLGSKKGRRTQQTSRVPTTLEQG